MYLVSHISWTFLRHPSSSLQWLLPQVSSQQCLYISLHACVYHCINVFACMHVSCCMYVSLHACMYSCSTCASLHACVCPCIHIHYAPFPQLSQVQPYLHVPDPFTAAVMVFSVTAVIKGSLDVQADTNASTQGHGLDCSAPCTGLWSAVVMKHYYSHHQLL